jgi:hypothetical protein
MKIKYLGSLYTINSIQRTEYGYTIFFEHEGKIKFVSMEPKEFKQYLVIE